MSMDDTGSCGSAPHNANNDNNNDGDAAFAVALDNPNRQQQQQQQPSTLELAFLVTHWLANYAQGAEQTTMDGDKEQLQQQPISSREQQQQQQQNRRDNLERLRHATSEMAAALASLGAYGTTSRPPSRVMTDGTATAHLSPTTRNATYGDMIRRWGQVVPPHQLESLVQAAARSTEASESVASQAATNLLLVARDAHRPTNHVATTTTGGSGGGASGGGGGGGRLADDGTSASSSTTAIATTGASSSSSTATAVVPIATSILQTPALLGSMIRENESRLIVATKTSEMPLLVESSTSRLGQEASRAMREYLSLRHDHQEADVEIKRLEAELAKQQRLQQELERERASIIAAAQDNGHNSKTVGDDRRSLQLNHIAERLLNTDRLIPQHSLSLSRLQDAQRMRTEKLAKARRESQSAHIKLSSTMKRFSDPSRRLGRQLSSIPLRIPSSVAPRRGGCFLDTIVRQYTAGNGGMGCPGGIRGNAAMALPKRMHGGTPSDAARSEMLKTLVVKRLTYSMTASAHLAFPIFCLCFDRTGRYFVTGADDCLVKVYYIGAAKSARAGTTRRTFSYGSNDKSAVLVCTLRGHAGVICDIHVSSDNAFLATASDDGDCRVWGLKDGAPIAILRGHEDGANMVSWSALVPYRLVTTGSDGLARMWDIREAARNRYGAHVGKRQDYSLPSSTASNGGATEAAGATVRGTAPSQGILATGDELLPPLPVRNNGTSRNGAAVSQGNGGTAALNGDDEGAANSNANEPAQEETAGNNVQPGQFVRNDALDEGVRLVAKLQHGSPVDANQPGASTRSRRKAVKVICIARCPRGGHFATGADDGICRVWSQEDADIIGSQDAKHSSNPLLAGQRSAGRRSVRVQQHSEGRLLAELTGHLNSITDLHYSNAGDRIVTASQKDGVARIWSWTQSQGETGGLRIEKVKQILLQGKRLESTNSSNGPSRRRPMSSNASCDVAVWTSDDSKIVTSQCYLLREGSAEIVEGSQHVLVWDSRSGQCLLGIAAAHNDQVSVLVPHPLVSSLLCSAGSDGVAKLWDLEKGDCILMHENKSLDIGLAGESNNEQRKHGAYLDGSFSPDGLSLVLTDDSGRFTMFNIGSNSSVDDSTALRRSSPSDQRTPSWMKEQYFANDYYELYYDTNGYCVERGSGRPPHLAPRSVRCSFAGAPWAEEVSDTFASIAGPLPLSENDCRRNRDEVRYRSFLSETDSIPENNRANLVSYYDPLRTALVDGKSSSVMLHSPSQNGSTPQSNRALGHEASSHGASRRNQSQSSSRLSSNYRWRGYEDILAEEAARDEEEDADDDEYVAPAARSTAGDEELSDDLLMSEDEEENSRATRRRSSSSRSDRNRRRRRERERSLTYEEQSLSRPTRVSARALSRAQPEHYEAESDSDSFIEEYLSTNNTPSGPHVQDYTDAGHFFRLPDSGRVMRDWLRRTENTSSYKGLKNYAPQVGDSVVYVPRAHYETLKMFPTLDAPWKHFPNNTRWPVVRCCVRDIRYRFPYEQYYRRGNGARCLSVVAVLTLEVTGIPALSSDRTFPWPKASFVGLQNRGKVFEASMFVSDCPEFVIPESLFTWRLESLENASGRTRRQNELSVVGYFSTAEPNRLRSGQEDQELEVFRGTLKSASPNLERTSDEHLQSSGYGTLEVEWEDSSRSILSPWEVALEDKAYDTPEPPTLSPTEKRVVDDALSKMEAREDVVEYFRYPVDESRYSDYRNRVELPMDFSFMRERLASGYYSNAHSVLSDARLIRDNCLKYNGASTLSDLASDVYDLFESEVRDHIDIDEDPEQVRIPPIAASAENNSSRAQRLARRQSQESSTRATRLSSSDAGSSLERLPAPEQTTRSLRNTRRRSAEVTQNSTWSETESRLSEAEPVSRTSRRSGTNGDALTVDLEQDHQDDSSDGAPPVHDDTRDESQPSSSVGRRMSTMQSSNNGFGKATGISSSDEWEERQKSSSEEESDASSPPGRRSTRSSQPGAESSENERRSSARRSNRARSSRNMSVASSLTGESLGSPRRSSRSHKNTSLADLSHSDIDEDESQDEDLEEELSDSDAEVEEEETPVKRRGALKRRSENTPDLAYAGSTKRRKQSPNSTRRANKRPTRNTRAANYLADQSDSDADDEGDNIPQEDTVLQKATRIDGTSKRTQGKASEPRSSKKVRSQSKQGGAEFPELTPWPDIDLKAITKVCKAMLRHMTELDEDGLFALPVVEQLPDLEQAYLKAIESPMDFRTIEEDKIQYYTSIQQLQDDLILVFRNCAIFNGQSSEYSAIAIALWEQLNDVFRNVCEEQGVLLPRRWR